VDFINLPSTLLFLGEGAHKAAFEYIERQIPSSTTHPDVHVCFPEGKGGSHSIESVGLCIQEMFLPPFSAQKKIFVFEEAHQMSSICANALLKVCEEPPADTLIIFIARDDKLMLPTLVARCRRLVFPGKRNASIEHKHLVTLFTSCYREPAASFAYAEIESLQPESDMQWLDMLWEEILFWYRDLHILALGVEVPLHYAAYKAELMQELSRIKLPSFERIFSALSRCRTAAQRHTKLRTCLRAFFTDINF